MNINADFEQGMTTAIRIIFEYQIKHGTDDLSATADTCDELMALIKGRMAQMVTHSLAKGTAPVIPSVVGSNPTPTATIPPSSLYGRRIVFTGALRKYVRSDAKYLSEQAGAIVQAKVNSQTEYLIVAGQPGSVKWNEAVKLGIPIICENDWLNLI